MPNERIECPACGYDITPTGAHPDTARAERAEAGLAALHAAGLALRIRWDVPERLSPMDIDDAIRAQSAALARYAPAAEAYRASVEAPLRAEIERLTTERDALLAARYAADVERDALRADLDAARMSGRAACEQAISAEAERDTLAATLAEVRRRAVSVASSLAEVEVGGHEGDEESGAHDEDCQACAIEATRAATGALWDALSALPADLAAERDRRVRADSGDAA